LAEPLADIALALPEWLTAFPPGIRLFEVELLSADNGLAIAIEASRSPSATELEQMLATLDCFSSSSAAQLWWKTSNQSKFVRLDGGVDPLELALTDDIRLEVQPGQFVQVNGEINRQMIDQVLSLVRKPETGKTASSKKGLAVDLFCGTGNFSLPLAAHFDRVIGIEGLEGLVRGAEANAQRNNMTNIEFMVSDLSDWSGMRKLKEKIDLVLLDPPRNGAAGAMPWVAKAKPRQIIYISCHPSTMVRDAKILTEAGYSLSAAGVMDMFPHTAHVEAIALFEK
jgi:23S rRNA (uracil1939-C5)-methyltransferase